MKHRANIFLVVRRTDNTDVVLGAYRTMDRADEVAAGYSQQWIDRLGEHPDNPQFLVQITTFHDE